MIYYFILIISTLIATGKALICKIIGAGNTTKKEKLLFNLKAFFVAFLCSLIFIISNLSQLTIIPDSTSTYYVWRIYLNGSATGIRVNRNAVVRPVVYLDSTVKIDDGNGSSGSHYQISK